MVGSEAVLSEYRTSQHLWLLLSLADCVRSSRLIVLGNALRDRVVDF